MVAQSAAEAEYIAGNAGGREIMYMRELLKAFGYDVSASSVLRIDSQTALAVAKNPQHQGKMRHLPAKLYWLRDQVSSKTITVEYVSSEDQLADQMTKVMSAKRVSDLRERIGLQQPNSK